MNGRKWPDAWSQSVAADHAAGLTTAQMAANLNAKFGCNLTSATVYKRMYRMGLANRTPKLTWTAERKARVTELYCDPQAGSFTQLARIINREFGTEFSRNAVISITKRLGLSGKPDAPDAIRYDADGNVRPKQGRQ